MKNSKLIYLFVLTICITVLIYSFFTISNKWYENSADFEKMEVKQVEKQIQLERETFFYEYFQVLVEPFNYDLLYEKLENKNLTKENLKNYLQTNLFSKIAIKDCRVDFVFVDSKKYDEYTKHNYIAYFYDEEYYKSTKNKDTSKAKLGFNISLNEYYPGNYKIEIPIN